MLKLDLKANLYTPINTYNPLIKYKFNTAVIDNKMVLYNSGKKLYYNAEMNSGKGVLFNGTDQDINIGHVPKSDKGAILLRSIDKNNSVSFLYCNWGSNRHYIYADSVYRLGLGDSDGINTDVPYEPGATVCLNHYNGNWELFINGYLKATGTYQGSVFDEPTTDTFLVSNRGNSNFLDGTVKDYFVFDDKTLTKEKIIKYTREPNQFFQDVRDGVIGNCVLNMPMDGDDKYVRDYANYNETVKDPVSANGSINAAAYYINSKQGSASKVLDNTVIHHNKPAAKVSFNVTVGNVYCLTHRLISSDINYLQNGKIYYVECSFKSLVKPSYVRLTTETSKILSTDPYLDFVETVDGWNKYRGIVKITSIENMTGRICVMAGYRVTAIGTFDAWVGNDYKMLELSGVYEISNFTTAARASTNQLSYGSQEAKFVKDGLWRGELSPFLELYGQRPALKIPMTDTELWENEFFQIEMVSKIIEADQKYHDAEVMFSALKNTDTTYVGLKLQLSFYGYNAYRLYLFNGQDTVASVVSANLDDSFNHIVFTVTKTDLYVSVNGVDGAHITHSFTPSGLNFADSIAQATPNGELRLFSIHKKFQDPAELYQKAIKDGAFGNVRSKAAIDAGSFEYTTEAGKRYIQNIGGY